MRDFFCVTCDGVSRGAKQRSAAPRIMGVVFAFGIGITVTACNTPHPVVSKLEPVTPVTMMEAPGPQPSNAAKFDQAVVMKGKYLVELMGCGSCHTDGALIGEPNPARKMAGSSVGIAFSNPLTESRPGVVYPANLTPDETTGIGLWTDAQILAVIRDGLDPQGRRHLPVMPWPVYAKLSSEDGIAILAYLRSLPAVKHAVPQYVSPGKVARSPYVHFGVYRSRMP